MYTLDMEMLRAGDIMLTAQLGVVSKTVRLATGSKFSHAILYVGKGSYIHSDGQGVHSNNIQRLLFEKTEYAEVLRIGDNKYVANACIFARSQIGKEYSVRDAINTKNLLSKKIKRNRQFCSRLVAQAYEYSGIRLVENVNYCTPKDIQSSSSTEVISGCLKKATDEEIEFSNSPSPLQKQIEITNSILSGVRKLTASDVQSFEDLCQFVIANPSYDTPITDIVRKSGYLNMWKYEMHHNQWRYDGKIFLSLNIEPSYKKERAVFELDSAFEQAKMYSHNYEMYKCLRCNHNLRYLEMNIVLYENLIAQMSKRIEAARYVIKHT